MADSTYHEAPAQTADALPVHVPERLVGRDALVARVYTQLKENQPVVVHGPPGIGKSALAAKLAAAYTEQPGGVLWLPVDNAPIDELLVRIGRAYGESEITGTEYPLGMVGAVASTLTHHKPLIVLDGVLDEQVLSAFIGRCATGLPVLIAVPTAPAEEWPQIELGPLDPAQAVALLQSAAGLPAASEGLETIAATLRYQPFALVLAGGNLAATKQNPAEYQAALKGVPGSDQAAPVLLALTIAFRSLSSALQGLILMMGATFTRGASAELLSTVSSAPVETINQVMNMLAARYLVEKSTRYGQPYYRLHHMTHTFAQSWLRGSNRLEELQNRMREALLGYARKYATDSPEAHDKLATELDAFVALARWAAERNDRDTANQLIVALTQAGDFINERGYLYELLQLRRLTASLTTAFPAYPPEEQPFTEEEADTTDETAENEPPAFMRDMFDEAGDDDEDDLAYEEDEADIEADESWRGAGTVDPADAVTAALGSIRDEPAPEPEAAEPSGRMVPLPELPPREPEPEPESAEPEEEPALAMLEVDEDEIDPATAPLEGIPALRAELMRARHSDDNARQAEILRRIAVEQVASGMENEAIATYNEAVTVLEDTGDRAALLETIKTLAALMVTTGNASAAVLHATRGVNLAREIGDDAALMALLTTLGDARQQNGENEEAERAYINALTIAQGDPATEAPILYKLGYARLDNSDPQGAIDTWEEALTRFREQGERAYEGRIMGGLGTAYGDLEQWSEAIRFHTSALHIAREVGDRKEEALQLGYLAYACVRGGELGQAVLNYRQALHLAFEAENREDIVSTIVDLAQLLARSGRHLAIAQLLIDEAAERDPNDRDVLSLQERIAADLRLKTSQGIEQKPVNGDARQYAANAYKLLEM